MAEAATEIDYIGDKTPVWSLTIAAFLKFQMKRKPMGQSGVGNFQKQVLKLLADGNIARDSEVLDTITAWCVRVGNSELLTYKDYPEEARASVIADLLAAFVEVREKYLAEDPLQA
jgi:hypothetical protein